MKIFLSSTYQDLHEHRKRVIEAIDHLRHNGADVEWLGMEAFGARDDSPADACIKFVDACDLYVGFFGVRYGSLDPKSKLSMTEVEYRRAVEKNKPRLIFLMDEKNARVAPSDFEPSPEGQAKLKALKEDLKKDRVVDFFTTPEDLAWKVTTALLPHFPTINPQALIPFPPIPYFAHSYPLQAHFTGRARERALLSEWLTRGERPTEPILVIEAIGGMGKSALAWFWLHNDILPLSTEHWSLFGLFWWSFYDERDFGAFLTRALDYASGANIAKTISPDRAKLDALVTLVRQKRFLFVLDGFERVLRAYARMDAAYRGDEVEQDARGDYRACADPNIGVFLKQVACGGCLSKFLLTSRLLPRELDELAGVRHLPLTGMDAADAVEFFIKQGIKGTRAEIQAVCADYGFHPLTLRLLAGTLARDPRYHADIRYAPRVNPLEHEKERKILDLAYNSLPPHEQKLISQLAAFRSPLQWETIAAIFATPPQPSPAGEGVEGVTEDELAAAITDLRERGLYLHDAATDTYDLHPIVRRYCYDRLSDRAATHARLATYFEKIEPPRKIQTLGDLQPTIELYHHTVRAGRYDEAFTLFRDRIDTPTYYQLGAYQLQIELLRALFPDGEDKPPRLKDESAQAWTLNELANSYSLAGQPRRAVPLFLASNDIDERRGNKKGVAIGLGNVATQQLIIGELKAAEQNLRRRIEICREIEDEFNEAVGHQELGRVLAYRGQFAEAERELAISTAYWQRTNDAQGLSLDSAYRALRALLMGDASAALAAARQAREFAEEDARTSYPVERDFIRAEWLIGAALVAEYLSPRPSPIRRGEGGEVEAERHLQEALSRDRAIGMVDIEAAILLEWARLRLAQAQTEDRGRTTDDATSSVSGQPSAVALMQESFDYARQALAIAERCEYRLDQADIHNFLAEWWMAEADRRSRTEDRRQESIGQRSSVIGQPSVAEALAKAKEHAERAKERAWCDGAPYHYKVAYERAEMLLKKIDREMRTL